MTLRPDRSYKSSGRRSQSRQTKDELSTLIYSEKYYPRTHELLERDHSTVLGTYDGKTKVLVKRFDEDKEEVRTPTKR